MKRTAEEIGRLKLGIAKPHIYISRGRWRAFRFENGQYITAHCAETPGGLENSPQRAYFLLGRGIVSTHVSP